MSKDKFIELIKSLDISEVILFDLKYKNFNMRGEDDRTIHFEES